MFQFIRTRAIPLVRKSRVVQIAVALCTILFIATTVYFCTAKTILAQIDGKTVKITTICGTVGQALAYSNLNSFPQDIVNPSRETKITDGLTVSVTRSIPVHLSVDGQTFTTRTAAINVGEAIADLSDRFGLQVKENDEVNVLRTETVMAKMEIKVRRAIPIVLRADGKESETFIAPRTVAEALERLGITLGEKDKVSLAMDHMLEANDQLKVVRVAERIDTVSSEIPFQVVAQPGDFPVGLPDQIVSRGSNGTQEQTVKLTFEDGQEVDRQVLAQRVVSAPASQIVSRGAATSISRGGSTISFKRAYVMRASAYCEPGGSTATGALVRRGIIAVDPKVIPLGQKVYVEGYGSAVALDTGGAIKGNRIDVYMESEEEALNYGVRSVIVYVQ